MEDYTMNSGSPQRKFVVNVAGLTSRTRAMAFFFGINKEVLPLKATSYNTANLIIQEARLQKATAELNEAQGQLDEKQRELDLVQAKYDQAMRDKQTLVDDAEACRRKMGNATALIDGLGGEKQDGLNRARNLTSRFKGWLVTYYWLQGSSPILVRLIKRSGLCCLTTGRKK
ncbi:hypothetical protein OS493_039996 [Desmophyllum pertusum]|uniref:Uncharacterized protein n=1 Tax=Desmophyllum pertusum TaxID=174260 RepID=A0A9W9YH09_9CNID|nr:hypothetical protein OS493_039996 [Desmophyllum pertusum]